MCSWNGGFLDIYHGEGARIVVVQVQELSGKTYANGRTRIHRMEADVLMDLRGNTDDAKITIYGSDGTLCRPDLEHYFSPGECYVIRIEPSTSDSPFAEEKAGDFWINGCGEHWLSYDDATDEVIGVLTGNRDSTAITRFGFAALRAAIRF